MSSAAQEAYDYQTSPIHRAMILAQGHDGQTQAYYELNDEAQLEAFEAFFPGYREFRHSDSDDWDQTRYRIYMCLYAGRAIKLICDGKRWGVTFGSIAVNGDLEAFIAGLQPTLVRPGQA